MLFLEGPAGLNRVEVGRVWRQVQRADAARAAPRRHAGELILADLIRGQRGSSRVAAEEGGEMGDPAAGGALGSELPDLVAVGSRTGRTRP